MHKSELYMDLHQRKMGQAFRSFSFTFFCLTGLRSEQDSESSVLCSLDNNLQLHNDRKEAEAGWNLFVLPDRVLSETGRGGWKAFIGLYQLTHYLPYRTYCWYPPPLSRYMEGGLGRRASNEIKMVILNIYHLYPAEAGKCGFAFIFMSLAFFPFFFFFLQPLHSMGRMVFSAWHGIYRYSLMAGLAG